MHRTEHAEKQNLISSARPKEAPKPSCASVVEPANRRGGLGTLTADCRRRGVTLVELMVYVVLFTIFLVMVNAVFFWSRKSLGSVERLEDFQDLRNSSVRISEELSYGARVLSPPVDSKTYNQLLFRNNRNEVVVIFLDEDSRLIMINYERLKNNLPTGRKVLANKAIEFSVNRPDAHLIKYHVRIVDPKGVEFVLANAVKMRNTDVNEP